MIFLMGGFFEMTGFVFFLTQIIATKNGSPPARERSATVNSSVSAFTTNFGHWHQTMFARPTGFDGTGCGRQHISLIDFTVYVTQRICHLQFLQKKLTIF